jgi:hypothetical protein
MAFCNDDCFASGSLESVALEARRRALAHEKDRVLVFDLATARPIDLYLGGEESDCLAHLASGANIAREDVPAEQSTGAQPRSVASMRTVGLLPRHWAWLERQPGGASSVLRRIVEDAMRASAPQDMRRARTDAAFRFMTVLGGDREGYEDAIRALFSDDLNGLETAIRTWPADIRSQTVRFARGES